MTVQDILPYFQLVSQIALVFGALFAGYQFLLHRRELAEGNALQVLTRLQSPEFQHAYTMVWELNVDATAEDWDDAGREYKDAAETVAMTFETIGLMVFNRMVPLDIVDQVIGGFLRESWRRTDTYFAAKRQRLGNPRIAEWYQWLAEQVDVKKRRRSDGAYKVFKNWKE